MTNIKSFEIDNYRSCIQTKFNLNHELTAMIGRNGAGKSTILNSIRLLALISNRIYSKQNKLGEGSNTANLQTVITIQQESYVINAQIFYDTNSRNKDEIYGATFQYKSDNKSSTEWSNIDDNIYNTVDKLELYKNMYEEKALYRRELDALFGIDSIKYKVPLAIVDYFSKISYYSATQFADPTKCPNTLDSDNIKRFSRYTQGTEKSHEAFLTELYISFTKNATSFKLFLNTVNNEGIGLIDNFSFTERELTNSFLEVRSGGQIKQIDKVTNIIIPTVEKDGKTLSPNQLSEGTFKTLALIFYILNDNTELLLIEEPEVCVHHGLLKSVIELIKIQSKRKQIIISTHSDYVLDRLKPENIILVSKDKILGTKAKPLTKSLSKNDFAALRDYLNESGNLGEYWKQGGFGDE